MQQLSEHVYGILTMRAFMNGYVIANGDSLTVVDLGMNAGYVDALEKGLSSQGWTLDNVRYILITHEHTDHVGGLMTLQSRINVPTYAHRLAAPVIRGEQAPARADPRELGFFGRIMQNFVSQSVGPARIDEVLNGDEILDEMLPGLQVVYLPGHAHGQIGFWLPGEKALIGGDVMMRYSWGLSMPIRFVSPDWDAAKQSIRDVAKLGVQTLCLGHGQPITTDAARHIESFAARL